MTTIGERLKTAREKQKLTLTQLSSKSGIARSTIESYEKDIAEPTIFRLMCICEVLNISLDWVAKGE